METVGRDAFITHHTLYHYFKTSKKSPKVQRIGPIFKRSTSQADDIILDACMKFENYLIKTVREDAFCSYCILNNYFKISKTRKIFKNILIIKSNASQVNDIILDACMQFENYLIKAVG